MIQNQTTLSRIPPHVSFWVVWSTSMVKAPDETFPPSSVSGFNENNAKLPKLV